VKTFTGKELGAGTDAKIYFELVGERGSSDFRQLDPTPSKYESGRYVTQTLPHLRVFFLHFFSGQNKFVFGMSLAFKHLK